MSIRFFAFAMLATLAGCVDEAPENLDGGITAPDAPSLDLGDTRPGLFTPGGLELAELYDGSQPLPWISDEVLYPWPPPLPRLSWGIVTTAAPYPPFHQIRLDRRGFLYDDGQQVGQIPSYKMREKRLAFLHGKTVEELFDERDRHWAQERVKLDAQVRAKRARSERR